MKQVLRDRRTCRYGVLLLNMGGPRNPDEIVEFLLRLFSDPFIMNFPWLIRKPLAYIMALGRKRKALEQYAQIGNKSPVNEETEKQSRKLEEILGLPVEFAMRYTTPNVKEAQQKLIERGVNRLVVFPLYPHYSFSTTRSSLEDFLDNWDENLPYRIVESHYNYPPYIDALSEMLLEALENLDPAYKTGILFSAHSIPLFQVSTGDPYVEHVKTTVSLVCPANEFPHPVVLAFQGSMGPVRWQGPSLLEGLRELRSNGVEQLIVHPISFSCENLETLYNLDVEFKKICENEGIKKFIRIPAPGMNFSYLYAVASRIKKIITYWEQPYMPLGKKEKETIKDKIVIENS